MGKLAAFIQVTLDGYFAGDQGDLTWAHRNTDDAEWKAFVAGNAEGGDTLVFGRVTYELMASYWPTPLAAERDPVVAERMNAMPKLVFSRTLDTVSWANTALVKGDPAAELRRRKEATAASMTLLGSGSLVSQLTAEGLIDDLRLVVNPLVLGRGKALFAGVTEQRAMRLTGTRAFGNGRVLLSYAPTR